MVKRYTPYQRNWHLKETSTGPYVAFEDYAKLEAENERLKEEIANRPTPDAWYAANRALERLHDSERSLKAENKILADFAREIIADYCWGESDSKYWDNLDPDGGSIQDLAEKMGLIEGHEATIEDVTASNYAEFGVGDTIFKFATILKEE